MTATGHLSLSLWSDNMAVMVSLLLYVQVGFEEALWKSSPHKYSYDIQKQRPKLKKSTRLKLYQDAKNKDNVLFMCLIN
jgi:hypothetical protein